MGLVSQAMFVKKGPQLCSVTHEFTFSSNDVISRTGLLNFQVYS